MRKPFLFMLVGTLLASCGKTAVDYNNKGEFVYYNRLDHTVQIDITNGLNKAKDHYSIAPGASITIFTSDDGPKVADPKGYRPGLTADTTLVQFNDTLCYAEYNKQGAVLHKIEKYTYEKRGDADYVFRFDIDSNLYNLAKACK